MANTRTHADTHADELQKQPPWETVNSPNHRVHERVRGSHGKAKRLHTMSTLGKAGTHRAQEMTKTHLNLARAGESIWQFKVSGVRFVQTLRSVSRPAVLTHTYTHTHVERGWQITALLLAWQGLGKPRWEDRVGVRASMVWECLWLHQAPEPPEFGVWRLADRVKWSLGGGVQAWMEVRGEFQLFSQRPAKTRGQLTGRVSNDWKFPASWLRLLTLVKNSKGYEARQTQITCGHSKQFVKSVSSNLLFQ